MAKYRGKNKHREAHPKIYVWSHTRRAEIEYFQAFKNYLKTPLLMPKKEVCYTPQELIEKVISWKKKEVDGKDGDEVWCIFDIDDFYKDDSSGLINAIRDAHKSGIKIAFTNECFELWILLHFEKPTIEIFRGKDVDRKIKKALKKNKIKEFDKNKEVFIVLLPFQSTAIKNAKKLLPGKYDDIKWEKVMSGNGNPSTSFHFLIDRINLLIKKDN